MTASHVDNINNSKKVIPLIKYSIFLSLTNLGKVRTLSGGFM